MLWGCPHVESGTVWRRDRSVPTNSPPSYPSACGTRGSGSPPSKGHLMPRERVASQSEVIRAI